MSGVLVEEFRVESNGRALWVGIRRAIEQAEYPLTVVLSHGLTNSHEDAPLFAYVTESLLEAGHDVLLFDYVGSGLSGGSFEDKTFSAMRRNLDDVLTHMQMARTGQGSLALFGRSVGGTLAAFHAKHSAVRTTVVVSAPLDLEATFRPTYTELTSDGFVYLDRRYAPSGQLRGQYRLRQAFYEELEPLTNELYEAVRGCRHLLVMQGGADQKVPLDQGQKFMELAGEPKRYVEIAGTGHDFAGAEHEVAAHLLAWLETMGDE